MSVARFIADQRTCYRVPHTTTCALLGVSLAWFYKWLSRTPTSSEQRRGELDAAVAAAFTKARGLHGSPRLHADLREAGWQVSEKTVADSMRRQGLVARRIKRRNGLTRQDKTAPKFPDLLRRDFARRRPRRPNSVMTPSMTLTTTRRRPATRNSAPPCQQEWPRCTRSFSRGRLTPERVGYLPGGG